MKWYNKVKTVCLDLDKISFWTYKNGELNVCIGQPLAITFNGNDAEEIYKMLTSQKEVL
jgi:hypothetical protein